MAAGGIARTSAQGWGRWRASHPRGSGNRIVTAGASRGDLAEIDIGTEFMRQLVQTLIAAIHPLHHLADETRREFLLVLRCVALAQHLRAAHHLRFHDAAGRHRHHGEDVPALATALRTQAVIAELVVQVLADQRRLGQTLAILGHQRGDARNRRRREEVLTIRHRLGAPGVWPFCRDDLDPILEAKFPDGDRAFADEGRCRRVEQLHHDWNCVVRRISFCSLDWCEFAWGEMSVKPIVRSDITRAADQSGMQFASRSSRRTPGPLPGPDRHHATRAIPR